MSAYEGQSCSIQRSIRMERSAMFMPNQVAGGLLAVFDKLMSEVAILIRPLVMAMPAADPIMVAIRSLLERVVVARTRRDGPSSGALIKKAVEGILTKYPAALVSDEVVLLYLQVHMIVLKALQDPRAYGPLVVSKEVTRVLFACRVELRFNLPLVNVLIRDKVVHMQMFDMYLAQDMESGANLTAVDFAMRLVHLYLVEERQSAHVTDNDLFNTVEMLASIATYSLHPPDRLTALLDLLRENHYPRCPIDESPGGSTIDESPGSSTIDESPGGSTTDESPVGSTTDESPGGSTTNETQSDSSEPQESDDSLGILEKTKYILREWVAIYHSPTVGKDINKASVLLLQQMYLCGLLKTDEVFTEFFRQSTHMCMEITSQSFIEQPSSQNLPRVQCFHTLNAFAKLIALLVKRSGGDDNTDIKIDLLDKALGTLTEVLLRDHEDRGVMFHQLPYHRMLIMLFLELNAPDPILMAINQQALYTFCTALHIIRPEKAPGFSFAWLELVSHRDFISRMLAMSPQEKSWGMYAQLLIDLFKFLAPFLRNEAISVSVGHLYMRTLKVLLVLHHDCPDFLCDYCHEFCDVIPTNCIQIRNLILSAYPRMMHMPHPYLANLQVDLLPEIAVVPRILIDFDSMIQPPYFKQELDLYMKIRAPVAFLFALKQYLRVSSYEPGICYNHYDIPLMNALVLYIGTQAVDYILSMGLVPNMTTIRFSYHLDLFWTLSLNLDTEGRYVFLNAMANQLRYANSHTQYFSCALLHLFAEATSESLRELIARVLLQRVMDNKPHPWGLLITLLELIRNSKYKFWNHDFANCCPEVENLVQLRPGTSIGQEQTEPIQEAKMA